MTGQPVLCIASDEVEAKIIKDKLDCSCSILLSGLSFEEEDSIVRSIGKYGQITISTSLCGRGTDVTTDMESDAAGGLFVVVCQRYLSNRIDNQVSGRTARQGRNGQFLFLSALTDEIWASYSKAKLDKLSVMPDNIFYKKGFQNKLSRKLDRLQYSNINTYSNIRKFIVDMDVLIDIHVRQIDKKFSSAVDAIQSLTGLIDFLKELFSFVLANDKFYADNPFYINNNFADIDSISPEFICKVHDVSSKILECEKIIINSSGESIWTRNIVSIFKIGETTYKNSAEDAIKALVFRDSSKRPLTLQFADMLLGYKREAELEIGWNLLIFIQGLLTYNDNFCRRGQING